jgi:hypothetical protein
MKQFCVAQAGLLDFFAVSLLFGFAYISLLIYQVVVNSRPYVGISDHTYPIILRIICPVVATGVPALLGDFGKPDFDGIPFCWLTGYSQFFFWYAWVAIVLLIGIVLWVLIVKRLLNIAGTSLHVFSPSAAILNSGVSRLLSVDHWVDPPEPDEQVQQLEQRLVRSQHEESAQLKVFRRTVYRQSGFVLSLLSTFVIQLAFCLDLTFHSKSYSPVLCFLNTISVSSIGLVIVLVFAPYHEIGRIGQWLSAACTRTNSPAASSGYLCSE